jgi:hypothetical protein
MRNLPKNISLLAVSILTVGLVVVAPVSARQGSDDNGTTTTTVPSGNETATGGGISHSGGTSGPNGPVIKTSTSSQTENETETEHAVSDSEVSGKVSDLQQKAKQLLETKREDGKTKSIADRQKACTARQSELTKKTENYSTNAQKHLAVFNSIYSKVLAFQAAKQLNPTNFDSLKATADAKQAAAQTAVAALGVSDITIDCTSQDPASGVATLKTAVGSARTALQEYRQAIKDVIVALEAAKTTDTTSSTEAN